MFFDAVVKSQNTKVGLLKAAVFSFRSGTHGSVTYSAKSGLINFQALLTFLNSVCVSRQPTLTALG